MRFTEEEESELLRLFRGDGPEPLIDPTDPPEPVEPEPEPPAPHVWKPDAPVIDMQGNTPKGMSHAEWERLQNMARTHGGDHNGISRARK